MEIFGVPGHPLFVHVPVILVPLSVLLLLATGWRREWRRWFIPPLVGLAIVAGVFSILAASSGEELEETVGRGVTPAQHDRIEEHAEAGELARNLALVFMVTTVGAAGVFYLADHRRVLPRWTPLAAYAGAAVIGLAAVAGVVNAGHSGAEAVWEDRPAAELQASSH